MFTAMMNWIKENFLGYTWIETTAWKVTYNGKKERKKQWQTKVL